MPTPAATHQALNCIIDDSALVAGIRDGTKNNLKQWIQDGLLNLYVPLHALERLNALREMKLSVSSDAQRALQWLDHITSWTENKAVGRVQLQGPEDLYQTWKEVEDYLLPDTPLSLKNGSDGVDHLSKVLDENLFVGDRTSRGSFNEIDGNTVRSGSLSSDSDLSMSPDSGKQASHMNGSTRTSADLSGLTDGTTDKKQSSGALQGVPSRVRPLLNFVVWRTHHREPSDQSSNLYILLTNDPVIQRQASKFGVRAKLLSQMRNIISRSDKRLSSGRNSTMNGAIKSIADPNPEPDTQKDIEEDEDEVVFNPAQRPGSSRGPVTALNILDPDHFGRSPIARPQANGFHHRGGSHATRGNQRSPRAHFGNVSRGGLAAPVQAPAGPAAVRGGVGNSRGRGFASGRQTRGNHQQPIDPDSFRRPQPMMRRGRAGFRGIWEPT